MTQKVIYLPLDEQRKKTIAELNFVSRVRVRRPDFIVGYNGKTHPVYIVGKKFTAQQRGKIECTWLGSEIIFARNTEHLCRMLGISLKQSKGYRALAQEAMESNTLIIS